MAAFRADSNEKKKLPQDFLTKLKEETLNIAVSRASQRLTELRRDLKSVG